MSDQLYVNGWLTYLVTSGLFFVAWFVLTADLRNVWVKMFLRFPMVAVVLMPVSVDFLHGETVRYAPVIAAVAVELVARNWSGMLSNLVLLGVAVALSLVFGVLWVRWRGSVSSQEGAV
ncbi:Uncharacterised protein [BD1-7 clade bacterium]|uniref:Uncharacterized protein n=1 Tax=BD1-7 clade bacterium TaxID=2029982 RepID=A0A5S9QSS2_9GAMM|nr:Uncharacterised protein [BD1-7 clade bacterium]